MLKEFSVNLTWICIKCVSLIQTSQYAVLLRFIESFSSNSDIFRSLTFYRAYGLYSCKRHTEALKIIDDFEKHPFKKQKRKQQPFEYGVSKDEMIGLRFLKAQLVCAICRYLHLFHFSSRVLFVILFCFCCGLHCSAALSTGSIFRWIKDIKKSRF